MIQKCGIIDIPQLVDILNVKDELTCLDKKLLSNERFVANAKPEVVQEEHDKQADYQAKIRRGRSTRIDDMKKLVK
jgi:valine--tRNA ligase